MMGFIQFDMAILRDMNVFFDTEEAHAGMLAYHRERARQKHLPSLAE
jgi:hypothetical protein